MSYLLRATVALILCLPVLAFGGQARASSTAPDDILALQFQLAAREFHVPLAILLAVSYRESQWDDHGASPSTSGGYGPMHLTDVNRVFSLDRHGRLTVRAGAAVRRNPALHTLLAAARRLHLPPHQLKLSVLDNLRGGAALLAGYERGLVHELPHRAGAWYGAVALYSGSHDLSVARTFANGVFDTIRRGMSRITLNGQHVVLLGRRVRPARGTVRRLFSRDAAPAGSPDCPPTLQCVFSPAAYHVNNAADPTDYGNYDVANRPYGGLDIRYIVIHDTEGSYSSAIAAFQNPTRYASANYVMRASDGQVTQMVPNRDIAWHAANYYVNMHAIGIEHEGVAIEGATWYSESFYEASASLVGYLAHEYGVPLDRAHIIGHDEVPGFNPPTQTSQHWDPGPFWDWSHYMDLLGAPLPTSSVLPPFDSVVTINPVFATNDPPLRYCYSSSSCGAVPAQGANFVYLYTAPSFTAPLVSDAALHPGGDAGTTQAPDWGDKAVTGQQFYRVDERGAWDAIDYGGQEVWFYNPDHTTEAVPTSASLLITPRSGRQSIPVYGAALPETGAYPHGIHPIPQKPLQYRIPAGQVYVGVDLVPSDYYWSPTQTHHRLITGKTMYYQIFFNHRMAFVRWQDVDVLPAITENTFPQSPPAGIG